MKQILLKTWLMLVCLLVGAGTMWAEEQTATLTFTAACGGSGTDDKGNSWTVTSDASESAYDGTKGIHYGTGKAAVSYLKLANSSITGTITKIVVNASGASGTSATIDVKAGGSAFGSQQSLTSSNAAYTFNGSASGNIEISLTQTSATKALYVKSVAVTYSTAADTRTAVNMTEFSATSTSLIKGDNTSTTITNDQNDWTPSYTYESSNTSVATVSNTGVITAVAKGTAKITASLNIANADATWKKGATASKTIDITVNNPSHNYTFISNNTTVSSGTCEEGEAISFPADPSEDGVTFMGWATATIDGTQDAAPTMYKSATMGTEDVTYYAVFAEAAVGNTFTQITATSALEAGGRYLIVGNSSSTYKALPVDKAETLTTVTPSSSKITNPAAELIWTLEGTAGAWKIKSVDNGKYLQISGGNLTFESSTSLTFNASVSSSKFTFTSSATSGNKVLSYYANGNKFNAYTSPNNVYVYKATTSYSNYCTTVKAVTGVAIKTAPTTIAYCEGEKFNPAGLEVTLTYEDATTKDVAYTDATASKFTFAPALDAALTTSDDHVAITINGQTANQAISVRSVSIDAPVVAEGTYTVKVGDAEAVTADGNTINALKGQKVVLASTPADGYKVASTPFVVTDEDDANVSVSTAGGQYSFTMPGKNVTITAQFTRVYTISAGSCENGSITAIKDKDDAVITETSYRSKVVVEATAETHYHLTGMYYVKEGDDAHNEISENEGVYSFTMPQSSVTVYATFADDTQYTVSWMVDGVEARSEQVYADVPVSAPAVDPVAGKVFRGWVAEEIEGTTDETPSYENVTNLTVDEDKVFYAVFATEKGTPETHNIITYQTENFPSSYAAAADYTLNGVSFNIVQAYINGQKTQWRAAGNSNGTGTMYNNDAMSISKITLTYDNSDNYKNFTVKVGNSANPTSGTEITGVVDANDNKVYVFDCSSENASYFVLTNGTNAGYLASIDITCGGATYSDYCTFVGGYTRKVTTGNYGTICLPYAVSSVEGATFYNIAGTKENGIVLTEETGDIVAGKPYIFKATDDKLKAIYTGDPVDAPASATGLVGNLSSDDLVVPQGSYVLSGNMLRKVNGGSAVVGQYRAYIDLSGVDEYNPAASSNKAVFFGFDGTIEEGVLTGISSAATDSNETIYNLQGQRIQRLQQGVNIINGRKVIR